MKMFKGAWVSNSLSVKLAPDSAISLDDESGLC